MAEEPRSLHQTVLQTTLSEIAGSSEPSSGLHPCVICLDEVTERAQALPCEHDAFDFLCLASWLEETARCPLCNSTIKQVQYAFTSSEDFKVYNVPSTNPAARRPSPSAQRHPFRSRNNGIQRPRYRRHHFSPSRTSDQDTALQVRRNVYRRELFSLHVGANRLSQFASHPPRPTDFKSNPDLLARAKTFARRELQVFDFLQPRATVPPTAGSGASSSSTMASASRSAAPVSSPAAFTRQSLNTSANAEFLLAYLAAMLQTVDLQDSHGRAEELLAEFLGRRHAVLFLHELRAWLKSPYNNLEAWDRHVQYAEDPRRNAEGEGEACRGGRERRRGNVDDHVVLERKSGPRHARENLAIEDDDRAPKRRQLYDRYVPRY